MSNLTELQLDSLTEIINIGMGQAADSLSKMLSEEVILSVPQVLFLSLNEASNYLNTNAKVNFSGVSQQFDGVINGDALLLFPEEKSLDLVRMLLQDSVPLDDITEMEQEALCEIGNIILNAGLSSISNFLKTELGSTIPVYQYGEGKKILTNSPHIEDDSSNILFIHVDFGVKKNDINGFIVFILTMDSIKSLTNSIDTYINDVSQAY